ncbi:MAG: alkane 1-monooxygenase [Bacteroidia bacterium]|nr:alkane 1-monooxygenase [Bacteroidia bacterium]
MKWRWLRYFLAFLVPLGTLSGLIGGGWLVSIPLVFAFAVVPLLEIWMKPDSSNLNKAEVEWSRSDRMYDLLLYLLLPLQYLVLFLFLGRVNDHSLSSAELSGMVLSMGLLCGVIGINVGHELGHRPGIFEKSLAQSFLLSSLYLHFYIEHNRGHHHRVGTPADPASARYGESLYAFWFRSIMGSYRSAWELERNRLRKSGKPFFSFYNQMLVFQLVQILFLTSIFLYFGWLSMALFLVAALTGILLLESVNYIEHYGLGRRKKSDGTYEKARHCHSWNSDHVLGRLLLFELSRHSDHHYKASKKYQLLEHLDDSPQMPTSRYSGHNHEALEHLDDSPQMPTGYPGMIMLALIPPLWFAQIHPILNREQKRLPAIELARY